MRASRQIGIFRSRVPSWSLKIRKWRISSGFRANFVLKTDQFILKCNFLFPLGFNRSPKKAQQLLKNSKRLWLMCQIWGRKTPILLVILYDPAYKEIPVFKMWLRCSIFVYIIRGYYPISLIPGCMKNLFICLGKLKFLYLFQFLFCVFTGSWLKQKQMSEINEMIFIWVLMFPLLQPPLRMARTAPAGTVSAASCLGTSRHRCRLPPITPAPWALPPSRPPSMESASLRETCCFRWTVSFSGIIEGGRWTLSNLLSSIFRPSTASCWWWQPRVMCSTRPRPSRTSSASTR